MIRLRDILVLLQIAAFILMALGYWSGYIMQSGLFIVYVCLFITARHKWSAIFNFFGDMQRKAYQWYRQRQAPVYRTPEQRAETPRAIPLSLFRRSSRYEDQPKEMYPQENK